MSGSQGPKRGKVVLLEVLIVAVLVALTGSVLLHFLGKELPMMEQLAGGPVRPGGGQTRLGVAVGKAAPGVADAAALPDAPPGLKLIYTADMTVAIGKEASDEFPAKLGESVRKYGGYVSDAYASRQAGEKPSGRVTLRVPSDKLNELMDWIGTEATVLYRQISVQDITEQYVDMEAQLGNLKATESRLTELLGKATGKLEEVLKVEQELHRVRGEIDRWQGRKRLWDHQVTLSTLTVSYQVGSIYRSGEPPAETFPERVRLALGESWDTFTAAMRVAAIGLIYAWPWLAVLLVVIIVVWACLRLVRPRRAG